MMVAILKGDRIQTQYRYKYLNIEVEKENLILIEKNTYIKPLTPMWASYKS